jgi:aryl-alcohol dehydrogenase-like predicted oxidoreductase
VKTSQLGLGGPIVSAIGLGCMGMPDLYGPADESESIVTIHAGVDSGINLLDTGDFYGMGLTEMLIRRAIEGRRKDVFIAVKFGALRGPDGALSALILTVTWTAALEANAHSPGPHSTPGIWAGVFGFTGRCDRQLDAVFPRSQV